MAIDSNGQHNQAVLQNRYALRNRYVFSGQLVMQTALHIGGGRVTLSSSDSPVMLTPDQKPFIPGSSFKGALRSTVEKIVPGLPGFSTCALIEANDNELKGRHKSSRIARPFARLPGSARLRNCDASHRTRWRIY